VAEQQNAGRLRRRSAFNNVADLYDKARPGYPEALFDDLATLSGVGPGARVLEIGCGTGQATLPLARRGYRVLGLEIGENLAAMARSKLSDYPQTRVLTSSFEHWPLEEVTFDLVVSATSFHWADPEIRFRKSAGALRDGGSLALMWNYHEPDGSSEGFPKALGHLYRRVAPELSGRRSRRLPRRLRMGLSQIRWRVAPELAHKHRPQRLDKDPDKVGAIEGSGFFERPEVRVYCFGVGYDAEGYLWLLETYTRYMALDDVTKRRLFSAVARLIEEDYGGRVVQGYRSELYVARRR
jgi:SAM-dependent methyltransferase